jgi:hypothetical protein
MIITNLIGGLGNQMFQYAVGKALAARHQVEVKVDTTTLNADAAGKYTQRHFELSIFERPIAIANENERNIFLKESETTWRNLISKITKRFTNHLYAKEKGSQYQSNYNQFPANTYLDGFWQSELYFIKYEDEIRKAFTFNSSIQNKNSELAQKISQVNSVAMHVRRGDYIINTAANTFHGTCSKAYYDQALVYLQAQIPMICLFIFSDDIEWCKSTFKYDVPMYFVDTNDGPSDLYLMSQCKHNIIANSSFSWWGAWLNRHINKIVIAPQKWFADTTVHTQDIVPSKWIKI